MRSAGIIQHFHNNPGVELSFNGEVTLRQTASIPCSKYGIFNEYNRLFINKQNVIQLKNLFTEDYYTRNCK